GQISLAGLRLVETVGPQPRSAAVEALRRIGAAYGERGPQGFTDESPERGPEPAQRGGFVVDVDDERSEAGRRERNRPAAVATLTQGPSRPVAVGCAERALDVGKLTVVVPAENSPSTCHRVHRQSRPEDLLDLLLPDHVMIARHTQLAKACAAIALLQE